MRGEKGSGLPGSTQLVLPGPALHCPALPGPGPALPCLVLPGPARPGPARPCPALRLVGGWGGGRRKARVGWRGRKSNSQYYRPLILVGVTIYLAKFSHNISRGHYLPCNIYCLVLACIKAIFDIRPLRFCHDLANI